MAGKLPQRMAVSCILFKKDFGGDLKLNLVRNRTLFLLLAFLNSK